MDILMTGNNAPGGQSNPPVAKGEVAQAPRGRAPESFPVIAQSKAPAKEKLTEAQRNDVFKQFKSNVESMSSANLKFSIDKDTDKVVIKVVDNETGKTIRQIPSEEVLAINKAITRNQGMLLHDKA